MFLKIKTLLVVHNSKPRQKDICFPVGWNAVFIPGFLKQWCLSQRQHASCGRTRLCWNLHPHLLAAPFASRRSEPPAPFRHQSTFSRIWPFSAEKSLRPFSWFSWTHLSRSYEAVRSWARVSMSSNRSAQLSLMPSFHSAKDAASLWPDSIRPSMVRLTTSTRSWPTIPVSRANSLNLSLRSWEDIKRGKAKMFYFLFS